MRKNVSASVCFPESRALCRSCLQARSYLVQRGGCGQCWEALLMGWLVLVSGALWWSLFLRAQGRKRLVLCMQKARSRGGYNKSPRTWVSQCQLCVILPFCKDGTAFDSTLSVMVKRTSNIFSILTYSRLVLYYLHLSEFFPGDSVWFGGYIRVPRGVSQTKQCRKW